MIIIRNIIILNYNSCADCRKCIGNLKAQQGVEQEIIVVDNCSREDDRKAVELLCKEQGCTFIANSENRGYNAGNNVGLRYAAEKGYEFALIANPDMEFPQTDYLATLLAKMQEDEDIVEYDITPQTIPMFYRVNYIKTNTGVIVNFSYYAETFGVSHITISNGATVGNTDILESDVQG